MLENILTFLKEELNTFIKTKAEDYTLDKVTIANLVAIDGTTTHLPASSIIVSLVNIEEERLMKSQIPKRIEVNDTVAKANPDIKLNLYVLFTANFGIQYDEALKFISYVISFFQHKNVFRSDTSPGLDTSVKKIIVDLHTLDFDKQNHMWGMLGARYMPSVLYKIRLVTVQEDIAVKADAKISQINENIN